MTDLEFEATMGGLKVHPLRQERVAQSGGLKSKVLTDVLSDLPEYVNWYE